MAGAFVKNVGGAQTSSMSSSLAVTVPAGGCATGNLIIVRANRFDATTSISSVSDSRSGSNVYSLVRGTNVGAFGRQEVWGCFLVVALQSGDTISVDFGSKGVCGICVDEFSGITSTTDGSNSGTSTSSTGASGSISPSNATDLIYGSTEAYNVTITQDADTNGGASWVDLTGMSSGSYIDDAAYKLTTSAATQEYNPSYSGSNTWGAIIAAWKDDTVAAGIPPRSASALQAVSRAANW